MTGRIKGLFIKYKSVIMYLIFGVLTTVVNIISFWVFAHPLGLATVPSNIIAWIISCTFAYITNRKWVFESRVKDRNGIIREVISFFTCRLATLGAETLFMWIFIDVLGFNDMIIKAIANIMVIVLNYVASKLIIFAKKKEG
ncbi:MAG: GtrA family protein [Clostridiales bacterium]|nr:GtrA family protein [Clostridiales bacterium]